MCELSHSAKLSFCSCLQSLKKKHGLIWIISFLCIVISSKHFCNKIQRKWVVCSYMSRMLRTNASHMIHNTSHITPFIIHRMSHNKHHVSHITSHRASHVTHHKSHNISPTCRKCGLASANPVAMLSDKYIEGLRQCCWINRKNRIVMTGRGSMAKDAEIDSFKLRTPVISRWNTTIPAIILQNQKKKEKSRRKSSP